MTIAEAKAEVLQSIRDGEHEMEAGYPYENPLNDRQRQVIAAYQEEKGECWLGELNSPKPDDPRLWKWDGTLVLNFGASFVVPCFDQELDDLIAEWRRGSMQTSRGAYENVKTIYARVEELGGTALIWN